MSVASVGTPTGARGTTSGGTITGTWGTGQTRTAGNLLVALIASAGSTAPTAPTVSGWTLQVHLNGTNSCVGCYTKTATGSDSAWSNAMTFGSGGCGIIQYELTGANTTSPIDVSGTTSGLATTSPDPVTSGNVSASGEYALSALAHYKSGGSGDTFSEAANAQSQTFTNDFQLVTSARDHEFFDHLASPTSGATCDDNLTWAALTSYSGLIVVIAAGSTTVNGTASITAASNLSNSAAYQIITGTSATATSSLSNSSVTQQQSGTDSCTAVSSFSGLVTQGVTGNAFTAASSLGNSSVVQAITGTAATAISSLAGIVTQSAKVTATAASTFSNSSVVQNAIAAFTSVSSFVNASITQPVASTAITAASTLSGIVTQVVKNSGFTAVSTFLNQLTSFGTATITATSSLANSSVTQLAGLTATAVSSFSNTSLVQKASATITAASSFVNASIVQPVKNTAITAASAFTNTSLIQRSTATFTSLSSFVNSSVTQRASATLTASSTFLSQSVVQGVRNTAVTAISALTALGGVLFGPRHPADLGATETDENLYGASVAPETVDGAIVQPTWDAVIGQDFLAATLGIETVDGVITVEDPLYGSGVVIETFDATEVGWTMQIVPITLGEFNDETLDVAVTKNSVAFNLTGYNLKAYFKSAAGVLDSDPSVIILSSSGGSPAITITNAASGLATIAIPNADLDVTTIKFWRLDVVDGGGHQNTAAYGVVTITPL